MPSSSVTRQLRTVLRQFQLDTVRVEFCSVETKPLRPPPFQPATTWTRPQPLPARAPVGVLPPSGSAASPRRRPRGFRGLASIVLIQVAIIWGIPAVTGTRSASEHDWNHHAVIFALLSASYVFCFDFLWRRRSPTPSGRRHRKSSSHPAAQGKIP